jgi:hypothetical protein
MDEPVKTLAIRDLIHAAKLRKVLLLKKSLIEQQLEEIRLYIKEIS